MDFLLTCHLTIVLAKLKTELDSGLLPKSLYEEMVRDAIAEFGSDPYDSSPVFRPGSSTGPHMGGNMHSGMNPNFGETVAVLTPIQQAVLDAIGDIDVSSIIPFIRRQRKKLLRQNSDMTKNGKSRVFCPECGKDFMNTQGLSTHLLAKHRRGLDDYHFDNNTNMYVLRSQRINNDVPISASQASDTFDISRLETADTMANLVSAAIERSIDESTSDIIDGGSSNSSDEESSIIAEKASKLSRWNKSTASKDTQDSISTVTFSATQASTSNGQDTASSHSKVVKDISSVGKEGDDGIDRLAAVSASQSILPSTYNEISSQSSMIQQNKMAAHSSQHLSTQSSGVTAELDSDSDSSVGRHDIEPKTDRRRFNRGTQQRKSYSKDTKLSVIGMRDQGKCTDEISMTMGIPKSNVEKWCSAKGREKILRDIYKDVVNHRPQVYGMPNVARGYFNSESESQSLPNSQSSGMPSTYRSLSTMPLFADLNPRGTMQLNGLQAKEASSVKPLASYSANFGMSSAAIRDTTRDAMTAYKPGFESNMNEQSYLASLKAGGKIYDKRPRDDPPNRSADMMNDAARFDKRPRTNAPASIPFDSTSSALPVATAIHVPGPGGMPSSVMPNMSSIPSASRGQKVVRRKTVPLPTASAAAAVAHTISFNNEGFSDSDDDNDVMGLLGEQVPIVALRRLTQMKQT